MAHRTQSRSHKYGKGSLTSSSTAEIFESLLSSADLSISRRVFRTVSSSTYFHNKLSVAERTNVTSCLSLFIFKCRSKYETSHRASQSFSGASWNGSVLWVTNCLSAFHTPRFPWSDTEMWQNSLICVGKNSFQVRFCFSRAVRDMSALTEQRQTCWLCCKSSVSHYFSALHSCNTIFEAMRWELVNFTGILWCAFQLRETQVRPIPMDPSTWKSCPRRKRSSHEPPLMRFSLSKS